MRVTHQSLQQSWVRDLQERLGSMDQLNRQIGSGVRIQKPSDDPAGAGRVVRIEEVVARNEQYMRNIDEALAVHRSTESALDQVYQRMVRAKGLAVEGANDASMPQAGGFAALSDEVDGIRTAVLQIALSTYQEKYLFTGTSGESAPYAQGGGAYLGDSNRLRVNAGNGQSVAVNLPGDLAFREREARGARVLAEAEVLPGDLVFQASDGRVSVEVTVAADRNGDGAVDAADAYAPDELAAAIDQQLRGSGANLQARVAADGSLGIAIADDAAGGEITLTDTSGGLGSVLGITEGTKNVFGVLDELQSAFDALDTERVGQLLGRLDRVLDDLGVQRGLAGSRSRNLEFARERLESNNLTSESLKAEIAGVDMAEAVVRVSAEEQAYQTALAAGARIFNVSILDFLR